VEKFFEPSVNAIVNGIKEITVEADPANTFIFLAGGFGASPWIFGEVEREVATRGLDLSRPDTQTNKAVAVGAVSYYLDHFVVGRIVRHTYGIQTAINYDPLDPEHHKRSHKKRLRATGKFQLEVFCPIMFKGTRVSGTPEFRKKFSAISTFPTTAGRVLNTPIICYTGTSKKPQWMDEDQGNFKTVAHISAEALEIPFTASVSSLGDPSFTQTFEVIYICGQTEFKVQLSWMEEGIEKRSDVALLHDDEEEEQFVL